MRVTFVISGEVVKRGESSRVEFPTGKLDDLSKDAVKSAPAGRVEGVDVEGSFSCVEKFFKLLLLRGVAVSFGVVRNIGAVVEGRFEDIALVVERA